MEVIGDLEMSVSTEIAADSQKISQCEGIEVSYETILKIEPDMIDMIESGPTNNDVMNDCAVESICTEKEIRHKKRENGVDEGEVIKSTCLEGSRKCT
jgi:hypothetical protein